MTSCFHIVREICQNQRRRLCLVQLASRQVAAPGAKFVVSDCILFIVASALSLCVEGCLVSGHPLALHFVASGVLPAWITSHDPHKILLNSLTIPAVRCQIYNRITTGKSEDKVRRKFHTLRTNKQTSHGTREAVTIVVVQRISRNKNFSRTQFDRRACFLGLRARC